MSLIRATLDTFASMLGVAPDDAEDALRSERAARIVLSRRRLLVGSAALCTGAAFGFPAVAPDIRSRIHRPFYEALIRQQYPVGLEVTDGVSAKAAKNGNRSPLGIAQDFVENRKTRDAELWREYCRGMKGARMLTWSTGLRALYRVGAERSDDEIVLSPDTTESDVATVIPAWVWDRKRSEPGWRAALLSAWELVPRLGARTAPLLSVQLTTSGGLTMGVYGASGP